MDKSSRQERSNSLSRESLLAAKLKSTQCGNFLVCLWGHWPLKHSLKAKVIFSMYLGKYVQYLLFHSLLTTWVLKQQNLSHQKLESTVYYSAWIVKSDNMEY